MRARATAGNCFVDTSLPSSAILSRFEESVFPSTRDGEMKCLDFRKIPCQYSQNRDQGWQNSTCTDHGACSVRRAEWIKPGKEDCPQERVEYTGQDHRQGRGHGTVQQKGGRTSKSSQISALGLKPAHSWMRSARAVSLASSSAGSKRGSAKYAALVAAFVAASVASLSFSFALASVSFLALVSLAAFPSSVSFLLFATVLHLCCAFTLTILRSFSLHEHCLCCLDIRWDVAQDACSSIRGIISSISSANRQF